MADPERDLIDAMNALRDVHDAAGDPSGGMRRGLTNYLEITDELADAAGTALRAWDAYSA